MYRGLYPGLKVSVQDISTACKPKWIWTDALSRDYNSPFAFCFNPTSVASPQSQINSLPLRPQRKELRIDRPLAFQKLTVEPTNLNGGILAALPSAIFDASA